jgi:integrase
MYFSVKFVRNLTNDIKNTSMSAKLRTQKTKAGDYSVYLDFYQKGEKRIREFLNLRVSKPYHNGSKRIEAKDKEIWSLAEKIRDQRVLDFKAVSYNIVNFTKGKASAIPYLIEKANSKGHDLYVNAMQSFIKFVGLKISFNQITKEVINDYIQFLQNERQVHDNTVNHYIRALSHLWKFALKDNIIAHNPFATEDLVKPKKVETKRDFLNIDEVRKFAQCTTGNQTVKNAFLFACFTGLRVSDIRKLQWTEIKKDENGNHFIDYRQKKNTKNEILPLSSSAVKILNELPKQNEFVFYNLPTVTSISKNLKSIARLIGLDKDLHFHVSRHTFATLALTDDIDIFTVSKLMGHSKVSTTQIYAKLIDEKKREAMDKMPEL